MTIPDTIEEETDSYRYLFSNKDDLKKSVWKNIHFGTVLVWCGLNQMIIHFSEASILPSVSSSIHPFLQIILVLNQCCMELNEFRPSKTAVTTFANSSVCFFYLSWPPMEIKQKIQQLKLGKNQLVTVSKIKRNTAALRTWQCIHLFHTQNLNFHLKSQRAVPYKNVIPHGKSSQSFANPFSLNSCSVTPRGDRHIITKTKKFFLSLVGSDGLAKP